jgi:FkbM family methyltransferase
MNVVQVGSNVGNDDLTPLIIEHRDILQTLILVEPLSIHNEKLKECYKDVPFTIENIAVTPAPSSEEVSFFYHSKDGGESNYQVASIDKHHTLGHGFGEDGLVEIKVACLTLGELFDKYSLKDIAILFIDAEGLDEDLIKSLDFEKYNINKLIYENLHLKNSRSLIAFLNEKGYIVTEHWGHNGWSNLAVKDI